MELAISKKQFKVQTTNKNDFFLLVMNHRYQKEYFLVVQELNQVLVLH